MIEYFNKLSADEIVQFDKFVRSPFHNTNKQLIKLFKYLVFRYPEKDKSIMNKRKIFRAIYRNRKYSDQNFRKLRSDYTSLFEEFLMQTTMSKNIIFNKISLLKELSNRNFQKRFDVNVKRIRKMMTFPTVKDELYYLNLANLENIYHCNNLHKYTYEDPICLQRRSDNIDLLFISHKLSTFYEMRNVEFNKLALTSYKKEFYVQIINFMRKNKNYIKENHSNIYIEYLRLMMFTYFDDKYLNEW